MTKPTHGGRRNNAGRKKTGKARIPIGIHLPRIVARYLAEHGITATIERAVTRTKHYRDWLARQPVDPPPPQR